jgi:UDP-glucose 4-epimerase
VPANATLVVGDIGDQELVRSIVRKHGVKSIIHFAGSIVVPESVVDPLGYYHNNTVKSRALMEVAVEMGIENFIFSSTAAVYGMPKEIPVREDAALAPMSPYGSSKLMTEIMLADTARAHNFRYVALRYFNVAGADPKGRSGQSTPHATHLIKVACETALGKRDLITVYGTDYATPDGTCVRDYIHVTDLVAAHGDALRHLRAGGKNLVANCGYGHGTSVLEVVDTVKRVSGVDFKVAIGDRRPGDPAGIVAAPALIKSEFGWRPRYDDLDGIVASALAWESALERRNQRD